jgi:hypothetical protein
MNNILLNNFFEKNEIEYLNNLIFKEKNKRTIDEAHSGRHHQILDDSKMYIKKTKLSRLNIYNIKINNDIILKKIIKTAENLYNGNGEILFDSLMINYCLYSKKYSGNNPELEPHVDSGEFSFIIDYQLNSNIQWPIYINYEKFILKNNCAITFYPLIQYHWRPIKDWEYDDYLEMLFFEFKTNSNLEYNSNQEQLINIFKYRNNIYKNQNM